MHRGMEKRGKEREREAESQRLAHSCLGEMPIMMNKVISADVCLLIYVFQEGKLWQGADIHSQGLEQPTRGSLVMKVNTQSQGK